MKFGLICAIVTPFDAKGNLDEQGLRKVIDFQLKYGAEAICAAGGTGEYLALSVAERKRVIDISVEQAKGKIPVVTGACSPGIEENIEIAKYAQKAGAAAVLLIPPFGVKNTEEGIINYYKEFSEGCDIPIILYNFPPRTGVDLTPSLVKKLIAVVPTIAAIKESISDISTVIDLMNEVGDKIQILCGDEGSILVETILGLDGAFLGGPNIFPDFVQEMRKKVRAGKVDEAIKMYFEYKPLINALFVEPHPGPLKEAMKFIGLPVGGVRTPLRNPSKETVERVRVLMDKLGVIEKYKVSK